MLASTFILVFICLCLEGLAATSPVHTRRDPTPTPHPTRARNSKQSHSSSSLGCIVWGIVLMFSQLARLHTSHYSHISRQQQQIYCSRPGRQSLAAVCRYDRRRSANNYIERTRDGRGRPKNAPLRHGMFAEANETIVADRARMLVACTQGQLALRLCLFLFSEHPQLLSLDTKPMAARILSCADVLGLPPADIAEAVCRCPALLDVLPLRLRSVLEALCSALDLAKPQVLFMLASDLNLLDTPPLRVRQYLEGLAQLLQAPLGLMVQLAWQCPAMLRVEAAAVQVRWSSLQAVLGLSPSALQQLLAQEPRLLMPDSKTLAANHAAALQTLNVSASTFRRWVFAAPMLLLVPASQLQARVAKLSAVLTEHARQLARRSAAAASTPAPRAAAGGGDGTAAEAPQLGGTVAAVGGAGGEHDAGNSSGVSSIGSSDRRSSSSSGGGGGSSSGWGVTWVPVAHDSLQLLAYISKDPRVLLLAPGELPRRLPQVDGELGLGLWQAAWLVMSHPSYLAVEPGLMTNWMDDVRHLADMSTLQAKRLAACPQVFLTMAPEDVLAALSALGETLNLNTAGQTLDYTPASVAHMAGLEPLLLVQHPAATAAAVQQLQGLVQDQKLRQQLVYAVPQMLMQGPQLQQVFAQVAALLGISHAQLAVILIRQPRFWDLAVPRHTWPCCPLSQQQRQQQGPSTQQQSAAAAAAAEVQLSPAAAQAAATMSALVHCGLRSPEVMQAAIVLNPALLQLAPEAALARVDALRASCSRSRNWQQQLTDSVSPLQLGRALVRALTLGAKMLFLVQCGWSGSLHLGDAVQMTSQEFNSQFGVQFLHWRVRRRQQQQQRGRGRAAASGQPTGQELQWDRLKQQQQQQWDEANDWPQQEQQQEQVGVTNNLSQQHQERAAEQQTRPLAADPADAADAFVQALEAKLAGKPAAAAGGVGIAASAAAESSQLQPSQQQQQEQQQQQQQRLFPGGEYDVYYEGVLAQPDSSSSSSSRSAADSSSNRSSSGGWSDASADSGSRSSWDEGEGEEEEEVVDAGEDWEGTEEGRQQQQQMLQVHAGWHQIDEQSQQQWQQQQRQQDRQAARGKPRRAAPQQTLVVNKRKQTTIAAQLSGLELYGTWLGCLLQPAQVVAASGCTTTAAAAVGDGGGCAVSIALPMSAGAAAADSVGPSAGTLV